MIAFQNTYVKLICNLYKNISKKLILEAPEDPSNQNSESPFLLRLNIIWLSITRKIESFSEVIEQEGLRSCVNSDLSD